MNAHIVLMAAGILTGAVAYWLSSLRRSAPSSRVLSGTILVVAALCNLFSAQEEMFNDSSEREVINATLRCLSEDRNDVLATEHIPTVGGMVRVAMGGTLATNGLPEATYWLSIGNKHMEWSQRIADGLKVGHEHFNEREWTE